MADIEDDVDPRVQIELEKLNSATDEINKLEVDLDESRAEFRQLLMDSTRKIDELAKKLGNCIEKARPYYEARIKAKEALLETQKAAVKFERANSAHSAAKEMVFLAEEGLKTEGRTFDHAWQEMLNHATMRVNESELERSIGEAEHRRTSYLYHEAETRVQYLQKDLKRNIAKSSLNARRSLLQLNSIASRHQLLLLPYFEMKAQSNQHLEAQKLKVRTLEKQVAQSKLCYSKALNNLEKISDEIHKTRRESQLAAMQDLGTRIAGVGAESSPHHKTPARQISNTESPPPLPSSSSSSTSDKWANEDDEEFMKLPEKLGPSASPPKQTLSSDKDTPEYLGLKDLENNIDINNKTSVTSSSGEKVRELLSQGMMMLNISSLTDKITTNTPPSSIQGTPTRRRSSAGCRKVPSPLEKSLLYLTGNGDDDCPSDNESLASVEMLSDEQIASLMLDRQEEDLLSETDEEPLLGPACQALNSYSKSPAKLSPAPNHPLLNNQ